MGDLENGEKDENWVLAETIFSPDRLGKSEAIMALGNGYMGLRSDNEEPYLNETRNLFISGTFNKAGRNEVTELPNAANTTRLDIRVDGERFSLEFGEIRNYVKQLHLKEAELLRSFDWTSPKGKKLRFRFSRFVSFEFLHLVAMKMEIESLSHTVVISVDSGIDAQLSNSGVQHFLEGERRILEDRFIQLVQTTNESGIDIIHNTVHSWKLNGQLVRTPPIKDMKRRKAWFSYEFQLQPNDRLELEKLSTVHTSRDRENEAGCTLGQLRGRSLEQLRKYEAQGYGQLKQSHCFAWWNRVWKQGDIQIDSADPSDQLALRFSLYHLNAMMPMHDDRMGIAAKALSGEGYKGHSFWDTEIFIFPYFVFSNPEAARSLLTYRYRGLEGARKKAVDNGYAGAMYPWEMAWPTDGEATPVYGDMDIVTGEQSKIWSGFIEQHISADIAFAVYQYEQITGDIGFLQRCGYEMVFETAKFWASRLEWSESNGRFHINSVIGPDEYKEHVDNNAFTNYMAYFHLQLALRYADRLKHEKNERWETLVSEEDCRDWQEKAHALYLPKPREADGIIPQDDTYLDLPEINLDKYKQQTKVRSIYRDYNAAQINQFQVTKQADALLVFYLLEQTFLKDDPRLASAIKRANFFFYEARTLHDSSLSLASHSIMASDLGERNLAYSLFKKSCEIDMGADPHTSDDGIHAAAIGGIWKSAVLGFAGIRQADGQLRVHPQLPEEWQRIKFSLYWRGRPVHFDITHEKLEITAPEDAALQVDVFGTLHQVKGLLEVDLPVAASLPLRLER